MLNVSSRIGDILPEYIQHDIITEQPQTLAIILDRLSQKCYDHDVVWGRSLVSV